MRCLLSITAAALLIGVGLVHGAWTNRWGPSPEMAALAARFESVPMTIGGWTATPFELDPRQRKLAGAEACLSRVYTDAARGISVSVLLLGGLPGNIATHTPDVCYRWSGFDLDTPVTFEHGPDADGPRTGFRTIRAVRGGVNPSVLRIFWSWHTAAGWTAPGGARWKFASEPTLCKLYVVRETGGAVVEPGRDPCNDFLNVFLPVLDRAVFSAPG
jgi:hypothetical protein